MIALYHSIQRVPTHLAEAMTAYVLSLTLQAKYPGPCLDAMQSPQTMAKLVPGLWTSLA